MRKPLQSKSMVIPDAGTIATPELKPGFIDQAERMKTTTISSSFHVNSCVIEFTNIMTNSNIDN